ncbi:MAG: hypothetical protein PHZ00_02060 [Candidatus Peribacteraceae bacterium]|nr:hypothetical protein [Candidatus Peribacteraceae bacterium]
MKHAGLPYTYTLSTFPALANGGASMCPIFKEYCGAAVATGATLKLCTSQFTEFGNEDLASNLNQSATDALSGQNYNNPDDYCVQFRNHVCQLCQDTRLNEVSIELELDEDPDEKSDPEDTVT